jgi:glycosyltransferase involved in cell wall biosynthesis
MWLAEALKRDCDVTVVTTKGWDLDELNGFYGTSIQPGEVRVRHAPTPFTPQRVTAAAWRGSCYQRFAQRIAREYDIRISACNPTAWGAPAVHFVVDFVWHPTLWKMLDPRAPGFIYRDSSLRKIYLAAARKYGRVSDSPMSPDDLVIANSEWAAELLRRHCNAIDPLVVYPAVWASFPEVAWERKENAFAMIGRIAPEKRIERAISILNAVRGRGHGIKLHLCGAIGDDAYGRTIRRICAENRDWIAAEGRVTGEKKAGLLAACRFGIQTRAAEPFGITVAEMARAGAIVFAPSEGGQAEILDHPMLTFDSEADAADKIDAVLRDAGKQTELRKHLRERASMFSAENFMRESRAAIAAFLARRKELS